MSQKTDLFSNNLLLALTIILLSVFGLHNAYQERMEIDWITEEILKSTQLNSKEKIEQIIALEKQANNQTERTVIFTLNFCLGYLLGSKS